MTSYRKEKHRYLRWMRYQHKLEAIGQQHHDFPWGSSIKHTPGYFGPRREMRYRGALYYQSKAWTDALEKGVVAR